MTLEPRAPLRVTWRLETSMPNDNPQMIHFVNEEVRPLCEAARALKARIASLTTSWFAGVSAMVTNDADPIVDGRDAEGVSRLTGADVTNAVGNLIACAAALNDEIIEKPTVQPLRVS